MCWCGKIGLYRSAYFFAVDDACTFAMLVSLCMHLCLCVSLKRISRTTVVLPDRLPLLHRMPVDIFKDEHIIKDWDYPPPLDPKSALALKVAKSGS